LFAASMVGLQPDLVFQLWSPIKSSDHSPQVFAFRSICAKSYLPHTSLPLSFSIAPRHWLKLRSDDCRQCPFLFWQLATSVLPLVRIS